MSVELKSYEQICDFLQDVADKFIAGTYDASQVKACVSIANEARGLAEDRSKYQAALESLLNQAKALPYAPQRKAGDAPLHGSPYPTLVPPAVQLNG